jgi:quercetin dioxygenase-like cupin family protein
MSDRIEARVVRHSELELLSGKVSSDGGELRQFSGSDYGLATSAMVAEVAPGSGARRHRHPHAEVFVLHDGHGRFEVEGTYFEAEAGDIVIIPPDAWHSFRNTGTGMLRQAAIHQNARAVTLFEDGSRRD